jgi:hypothetical protein
LQLVSPLLHGRHPLLQVAGLRLRGLGTSLLVGCPLLRGLCLLLHLLCPSLLVG